MKDRLYYLANIIGILLGLGLISLVMNSCTINVPSNPLDEKTEIDSNITPNSSLTTPVQAPTVIHTPATTPTVTTPKFGPGSANNINTPTSGYLNIRTNSALGKLSLRANPAQTAATIVEIPNGVSGIIYYSRQQIGDYVWYYAEYQGQQGFLRGDYLDAF